MLTFTIQQATIVLHSNMALTDMMTPLYFTTMKQSATLMGSSNPAIFLVNLIAYPVRNAIDLLKVIFIPINSFILKF